MILHRLISALPSWLTKRDEVLRLAFLVFLTALIWCAAYNRWTLESWQTPVEYGTTLETSDAKGMLAMIKAAADGRLIPFFPRNVPELGAPYPANWDDVPLIEQFQFFGMGLLARVIGLFPAANVGLMLAQILAALALYLSARAWGARWEWSFAAAIIFAFSRMALARQIHHFPVAFYWHVPLCLLVCWWILDGRLQSPRRMFMALAVAVLTGIQNPYYTNMFLQLAGLSCAVCLLRRQWEAFVRGAGVIALTIFSFFLMMVNSIIFHWQYGGNPNAVTRNYRWLEYYALKPLDLIMPPPDHIVLGLRTFSQNYFSQVLVGGETPPSSYLGVIGLVGIFWLIVICLKRSAFRPVAALPMEAWQILWIFAYSTIGGFNNLVGSMGLHLFRSTNRFSIFILAIALLFLVRELSKLRTSPPFTRIAALLIMALALLDELPPIPSTQSIRQVAALVDSDRTFSYDLEKSLPEGSMVYQLPASPFPESSAPGLPPYDHFRPYFYSSALRYSYGNIKGRQRDDWQYQLGKNGIQPAITELEDRGFAAIYIYPPALRDGGKGIVDAAKEMGRDKTIVSRNGDAIAILLSPKAKP